MKPQSTDQRSASEPSIKAPGPRDALILATDESALRIGAEFVRLLGNEKTGVADALALDWPMMAISGTGGALRLIQHVQPKALFVCVGPEQLETAAALIETVRRRRSRLPQLALAGEHDERVERAVRIAGASYYFPVPGQFDHALVHAVLNTIGIGLTASPAVPAAHNGPSPPARHARSRAAPAPPAGQARGRPRIVFRP